jgi:hypothetical protein
VKRSIFNSNDPREVLEAAGEWIGANFAGASEQVLAQFTDYFADHVLAGRRLGQSVADLLDDLFWGDFDEDLLNDAAERAAREVAQHTRR